MISSFVFLAAATLGDGPAELVHRTYDLSAAWPAVHLAEIGEPLAPFLCDPESIESVTSLDPAEPESLALELLYDLFETEFEYEGRSMQSDDRGRLHVVAPAAVQDEIAAVMAAFESALRRPLELRIDFVERTLGQAPLPALMAADEAEKIVAAAGAGARSVTLRLEPGRVATLDASREIALVTDFDVEIAQASFQHDPVVSTFPVGTRILARAAAGAGGARVALLLRDSRLEGELRATRAELGGTLVLQSDVRTASQEVSIQIPTVLGRALALNLFVPSGQAAVIDSSLSVATGSSHVAIFLRANAPPREPVSVVNAGAGRRRTEVLDASYLFPPHVEVSGDGIDEGGFPRRLDPTFAVSRERGNGPSMWATLHGSDPSRLLEDLQSRDAAFASSAGPWVFARAGSRPDPASGAPSLFEREGAQLGAGLTSEGVGVSVTLRRRSGEALAQCQLPVALGETSAVVLGGETLAVSDMDVEVAQFAGVSQPVVATVFDGLVVRLEPARAADGSLLLQLAARGHVLAGPSRRHEWDGPPTARIDLPDHDSLVANERLSFAAKGGVRRVVLGGAGGLALEIELR